MKFERIAEREFRRQAGPRFMFGFVRLSVTDTIGFCLQSLVSWPESMDKLRYEAEIRKGILKALNELKIDPAVGHFKLLAIGFSDYPEANVPFAYGEAARQTTHELFKLREQG